MVAQEQCCHVVITLSEPASWSYRIRFLWVGTHIRFFFFEVADDHYKDQITSRRAQGVPAGRVGTWHPKDIRMLQPVQG